MKRAARFVLVLAGAMLGHAAEELVYGLYGLTPEEIQIVEGSAKK